MAEKNDKIVFFDFDRTLTNIDSTLLLAYFILKKTKKWYKFTFVLVVFILFRFGLVSEKLFKKKLCYLIVKDENAYEIRKIVVQFYESYANALFNKKITNLLLDYSKAGFGVHIVSSNFDFIVEPIFEFYPIDGIHSTVAESKNSIYTGNIKGSVCNSNEKLLKVSAILKKSTKIFSIGYGNSVGDYPLLKSCNFAYLVRHKSSSQFNKLKLLINLIRGKLEIAESQIVIEKFT